jgi:hypothetical protein
MDGEVVVARQHAEQSNCYREDPLSGVIQKARKNRPIAAVAAISRSDKNGEAPGNA